MGRDLMGSEGWQIKALEDFEGQGKGFGLDPGVHWEAVEGYKGKHQGFRWSEWRGRKMNLAAEI